jgi:hypothetical protein
MEETRRKAGPLRWTPNVPDCMTFSRSKIARLNSAPYLQLDVDQMRDFRLLLEVFMTYRHVVSVHSTSRACFSTAQEYIVRFAHFLHPIRLVHLSSLVEARVTERMSLVAGSLECMPCFQSSEELCSNSVSLKRVAFASTACTSQSRENCCLLIHTDSSLQGERSGNRT